MNFILKNILLISILIGLLTSQNITESKNDTSTQTKSLEDKLKELGIILPPSPMGEKIDFYYKDLSDKARMIKDRRYGSKKDNLYDMFLPKKYHKNSPVLIFIHGGAWVSKDINECRHMGSKLAERGIATAIIQYTLSPRRIVTEVKHPIHIKDALLGFLNVTKSLKNYDLDDKNLFIGGHSAGAFLSSLIALDATTYLSNIEHNDELEEVRKIKGVVSIGGVFDLELAREYNVIYGPLFLNSAFGRNAWTNDKFITTWNKFSPQYIPKVQLGKIGYSKLPRYLLIHSTQDPLIHVNQCQNFEVRLKQMGIMDTHILQGFFWEHNFIPTNPYVQDTIEKFMKRNN